MLEIESLAVLDRQLEVELLRARLRVTATVAPAEHRAPELRETPWIGRVQDGLPQTQRRSPFGGRELEGHMDSTPDPLRRYASVERLVDRAVAQGRDRLLRGP